jgi:hypothetical protein
VPDSVCAGSVLAGGVSVISDGPAMLLVSTAPAPIRPMVRRKDLRFCVSMAWVLNGGEFHVPKKTNKSYRIFIAVLIK